MITVIKYTAHKVGEFTGKPVHIDLLQHLPAQSSACLELSPARISVSKHSEPMEINTWKLASTELLCDWVHAVMHGRP